MARIVVDGFCTCDEPEEYGEATFLGIFVGTEDLAKIVEWCRSKALEYLSVITDVRVEEKTTVFEIDGVKKEVPANAVEIDGSIYDEEYDEHYEAVCSFRILDLDKLSR